jgi:D-alanyl-D-alanine carboxypeptidase
MSYWEAYEETALNVALPGKSEHALGLALDLISNQYSELDEKQQTTAEAKWLAENCYKYGFILRYPPEKTNITGIVYEPWHYRYVGEEHAAKITERGITLEEYIQEYYEAEAGGQ